MSHLLCRLSREKQCIFSRDTETTKQVGTLKKDAALFIGNEYRMEVTVACAASPSSRLINFKLGTDYQGWMHDAVSGGATPTRGLQWHSNACSFEGRKWAFLSCGPWHFFSALASCHRFIGCDTA